MLRKAMYKRTKGFCSRLVSKVRKYRLVNDPTKPAIQIILPKPGYVMLFTAQEEGKPVKRKFVRFDLVKKYKGSYQDGVLPDGSLLSDAAI